MELPVQPMGRRSGRNYEQPPWCYLLWGVPAAMAVGAAWAYNASALSLAMAGTLWVGAVAWAGVGCLVNARSCGRVHCRIDGVALPALAVFGVLNLLGVVSIGWSIFWLTFIAVLVASFVPEWTWKKYS